MTETDHQSWVRAEWDRLYGEARPAAPPPPPVDPAWSPPPPPGDLPPAPRPGGRRIPALVALVAVLIAGIVAGGGAIGYSMLTSRQHWPRQWDPRIQPIVNFVEYKRGLHFKHPVQVDFLSPAAFQKKVADNGPVSASDRRQLDEAVASLRAVGLLHGNVDLHAAANQLVEQGVIGVYMPETKHVYVRGTQLSPYGRVTLAHELTHALQDQYFDLLRIENLPHVSGDAVRSLIEGDAVRVERDYADALPPADKASYQADSEADSKSANLSGIPDVLTHSFAFPYAFGPTFVSVLNGSGGTAAIDEAFRHPPATEAQVLNPDRYLSGMVPQQVQAPALPSGDKAYDKPSEFGEETMLEVLGNVVGYQDAWNAVRGWQGDQAVSYSHHGTTCVAVATATSDTSALRSALDRWAGTVPGATVTQRDGIVELRSCDPGPNAPAHQGVTPSAFDVLRVRAELIEGAVTGGNAPAPIAACAADKIISQIGPQAMVDLDSAPPDDPRVAELRQVAARAGASCAAGNGA